ncbi:MAG: hypothetical protein V4477_17045 [Pseudomonadota bacterium]
MIEQWQIAAIAFGAFICVGIGYYLRSLEERKQPHDDTEHGVGRTL